MKATHLLSLLMLCVVNSNAQSLQQGPFSGSNFSTSPIFGSNASWNNVTNAGATDNQYADFGDLSGPAGIYTNYLVATGFGFSIPAGAIIKGISVKIRQSDSHNQTSDFRVRLLRKGTVLSTDRAEGSLLGMFDTDATYGNETDLWGTAWAPKDFGIDFGVAIAMQRGQTGSTTAGKIDNIQVTVYYTFITLPVNLTSFSAKPDNSGNSIRWQMTDETAMDKYDLERSADGRNFSVLTTLKPKNQTGDADYSFTDDDPLKPVSFYRLHMTGAGGFNKYSSVVSVRGGGGSSFMLFPNPLQNGQSLHISNNGHENLTIELFTLTGKKAGSITTDKDQFPSGFLNGQTGTFLYRVSDAEGNIRQNGKIVVR